MSDKQQIEKVEDGLLVRAPAKVNLSLLIAGKRPDGFHELETIMAKISLFDEILIEQGTTTGIELQCKGPHWAPAGRDNLVCKAAELLLEAAATTADVKITLTKNIPAGSGLGSASSDAAATLIGLNELLRLGLPPDALAELAAQLGSDVAFFIFGPLAMCTGRGEKVANIKRPFEFEALVVLPDVNVSTKKVYENYTHLPKLYQDLHIKISEHAQKGAIDAIAELRANMLAKTCYSLSPQLAELKRDIEALGIGPLCLSGSGSAMFCMFDTADQKRAEQSKHELREKLGCESIIVGNNRW